MRLSLSNFKQHLNAEFDFPEKGLVRLNGKSGIGKSTIFEAIDFAITGSGDDLVTWGQKSCKVVLELDSGLIITRTKRPESLAVLKEGREYREDEAQAIIYQEIGQNGEEFEASSYIVQGQANSILNLKPADQLRFIQKLTQTEIDPDSFKKHIMAEQRASVAELSSLEAELHNTELAASSAYTRLLQVSDVKEPSYPAAPDVDLNVDFLAQIKEENQKIETLQKTKLELELLNTQLLQNASATETINNHISDLQKRIQDAHGRLTPLTHVSAEEAEHLKKYIEFQKVKQESTNKINEIKAFYQQTELPSAAVFLQNRQKELLQQENDTTHMMYTLKAKVSELRAMGSPVPCPHCQGGLMIQNGQIHKHAHLDVHRQIADLLAQEKSLSDRISAISVEKSKISQWITELNYLKQKYSTFTDSVKLAVINEPEAKLREILDLLQQKALISADIESLKQSLTSALTQKEALIAEYKKLMNSQSVDPAQVSRELAEAQAALDQLKGWANAAQKYRDELDLYHKQLNHYRSVKAIKDSLQTDIDRNITRKQQLIKDISKKKADLVKYSQLIDIVEKAAVESIESVIDMINMSAQKYLDAMFPEGLLITLANYSTTQKGEERAKIGIKIFHQGQMVKSLKSLSGGQQSRAALAFQLGLSNMYNCPFLLVDEGLTGVDSETQALCIESLKQFSEEKLIIMIEHHADGYIFDEQINIGG